MMYFDVPLALVVLSISVRLARTPSPVASFAVTATHDAGKNRMEPADRS